ncbi:MAG: hypothetical protein WA885_14865 [Phormidesmis sp.]
MSRPIQMEEYLSTTCLSTRQTHLKPIPLFTNIKFDNIESENFSIKCLFRVIQVGSRKGLLARINYRFPKAPVLSAQQAFYYAEKLNQRLVHSKVFVVQDIDGDRSYFVRIDTVLYTGYDRRSVANLLDNVSEDWLCCMNGSIGSCGGQW